MGNLDAANIATIVGALGLGGLLSEVARQWFARSGRTLDEAAAIRAELRQDKRELEARIEQLTAQLDRAQSDYYNVKTRCAIMEADNRRLKEQLALVERRCFEEHGAMRSQPARDESLVAPDDGGPP